MATLSNTGDATLDWSVSSLQDWVRLSAIAGSLLPGASDTITVTLDPVAAELPAGTHSDELVFFNLTSQLGNTARSVALNVRAAESPRLTVERLVGQLRLQLIATPGSEFLIETSLDLIQWIPLRTSNVRTDGVLELIDSLDPLAPQRFYRATPVQ